MTNVSNNKASFDANTNPDIPVRTKNIDDNTYSGNRVQVIELLNQISGFSTETKLEAVRALLDLINQKTINTSAISGSVEVSNFPSSFEVNLITGFATSTLQTALNTKIDTLIAQMSPVATGYTEANVTLGTTASTVLALNANRKGGFIQNLSDTDVFISEFIAPTTTTGFVIAPYGTYIIKSTNLIRGITSASGKIVRVASW